MNRIMIVDDEPMAQSHIRQYLQLKFPNYQITGIYGNGTEAYEAFLKSPADIVITDIRMPVMDGLELIKKLKELPVFFIPVIISGYSDFSYAKTAMHLGVIHYLLKPLDFAELKQCLEAASVSLRQNRLLHDNTSSLLEEQELFFVDLVSGLGGDPHKLSDSFRQLGFSFSLSESSGVYLRLSLSNPADTYHYERETLGTAFTNLLHMLFHPKCISIIFRTRKSYDILVIHPGISITEQSLQELCFQAKAILALSIQAQLLFAFQHLKELASIKSTTPFSVQPSARPSASAGEKPHAEAISAAPHPAAAGQEEASFGSRESIRLAIAYIKEHYSEDLTREELASRVYMSSAHFSRLFKQETGVSFLDYLTEVRMQKALLLLNTNIKVQDIGKMVGYPSKNRFFINFRNYTSYTPTEYRRNVLKIMN